MKKWKEQKKTKSNLIHFYLQKPPIFGGFFIAQGATADFTPKERGHTIAFLCKKYF